MSCGWAASPHAACWRAAPPLRRQAPDREDTGSLPTIGAPLAGAAPPPLPVPARLPPPPRQWAAHRLHSVHLLLAIADHSLPTLLQASTGSSGGRLVHASAQPDAGSSSASSRTATVATPAPAASPSTSVAPASDIQTRQLRLLPWQTSASAAAAAAATADGSRGAASSSNRARQQPGADPAAPVCAACGGKHFLVSSRGTHPCHVCQQWRQAPEYRPGAALLTLQDVDLALLDGASDGGSDGEGPAAGSGSDGEGGSAASSSGSSGRRGRRKAGPMTAERKQAISRALQSKGSKSEEHKR